MNPEATEQSKREARAAVCRRIGYDPYGDLNGIEINKRGGDNRYEKYELFKCPKCSHPFLAEWEVCNLCFDLNDLRKCVAISDREPSPCPICGFDLSTEIVDVTRNLEKHEEWLLTLDELQAKGLGWLVLPGSHVPARE